MLRGMGKRHRNWQLAEPVYELLDDEKSLGGTITSTTEAAVYWFLKHMTPNQQKQARAHCREWIRSYREADRLVGGAEKSQSSATKHSKKKG